MKNVFASLASDFFSTIVFLVVYLVTDNVLLATGIAIAGAIAQVIYSRIKGKALGFMTYASLALVIVLGSATLLTTPNEPWLIGLPCDCPRRAHHHLIAWEIVDIFVSIRQHLCAYPEH